jgi:hypothetical protein
MYHRKLYSKYKANRKISKLKVNGDHLEDIEAIIDKNIEILEKGFNAIPNCYYFHLVHLESDFIPHFVIKHLELDKDPSTCNIILSNDKDLLQTVSRNSIQILFDKKSKEYIPVTYGDIREGFVKFRGVTKTTNMVLNPLSLPFILATLGDPEDGVPGIKGIGKVALNDFLEEGYRLGVFNSNYTWSLDTIKEKLSSIDHKVSRKILENYDDFVTYFHLTSFDSLISKLSINKLNYITGVINKEPTVNINTVTALTEYFHKICKDKSIYSSLIPLATE